MEKVDQRRAQVAWIGDDGGRSKPFEVDIEGLEAYGPQEKITTDSCQILENQDYSWIQDDPRRQGRVGAI